MRTAQLLAVAVVGFASLPLMMAQQVNANASTSQNGSASAAGAHMNNSGAMNAQAQAQPGSAHVGGSGQERGSAQVPAMQMQPVRGELEGKLDSKSAKKGDSVVLKTTRKMKMADGTVLPKGTRLVGHVTDVQAHSKGHENSTLGLEFDRAELKNGQHYAIHSVIESVMPSASAMEMQSMSGEGGMDAPAMGAPPMGGGMMGGGGAHGLVGGGLSGGRAGGGLVGGTVGGVTSTAGGMGSGLDTAAGGALNTTGRVTGGTMGGLNGTLHGAANGAGTLTAHATGIPGVMLAGSGSGAASGVLSASRRNVHLDSGTQMVLGLAMAAK